jgi:sugar lactone lactonase YvrE
MSGTRELTSIVRPCRFFVSTLAMLTCFALPSWAGPLTLFVSDQATDVIHCYNATTGAQILPDIPLLGVTGLATGPSGDLFAVSAIPSQVYRYDSMTGAPVGVNPFVAFTGQNDGHDVQGPNGMAFAPNGNLYIADTTLSNVHEYDTAGNSVASLGAADPSAFFSQPTDVAIDSIGDLYVVNPGNGNVLKSLGGTQPFTEFFPTQTGGLTIPSALTFGPDGKLYVLDSSNSGGPAIRRYTAAGAADGTFISYAAIDFQPNDIAFGPDGNLYVSGLNLDTADGQVLRYLPDGTADGALVASGPSYPTFMAFSNVPEPASITLMAIAGSGLLLVARRSRRV